MQASPSSGRLPGPAAVEPCRSGISPDRRSALTSESAGFIVKNCSIVEVGRWAVIPSPARPGQRVGGGAGALGPRDCRCACRPAPLREADCARGCGRRHRRGRPENAAGGGGGDISESRAQIKCARFVPVSESRTPDQESKSHVSGSIVRVTRSNYVLRSRFRVVSGSRVRFATAAAAPGGVGDAVNRG